MSNERIPMKQFENSSETNQEIAEDRNTRQRISRRDFLGVGKGIAAVLGVKALERLTLGSDAQDTPPITPEPITPAETLVAVVPESETSDIVEFFNLDINQIQINPTLINNDTITIKLYDREFTGKRFKKTESGITQPVKFGVENFPNAQPGNIQTKYSGILLGMLDAQLSTEDLQTSPEYQQFLSDYGITFPSSVEVRYFKLYYEENGEGKIGLFSSLRNFMPMAVSNDGINLGDREWEIIDSELQIGDQLVLSRFKEIEVPDYNIFRDITQDVREYFANVSLYFFHIQDLEKNNLPGKVSFPNVSQIAYKN